MIIWKLWPDPIFKGTHYRFAGKKKLNGPQVAHRLYVYYALFFNIYKILSMIILMWTKLLNKVLCNVM